VVFPVAAEKGGCMRVYLTKSLNRGIEEVEAECTPVNSIRVRMTDRTPAITVEFAYRYEGLSWHRTLGQAVHRMRVMRDRRRASLQRELSRLDAMELKP
jgi:hypothetical protein